MKYRKKPVVVEAIQLTDQNVEEILKFCDKIELMYIGVMDNKTLETKKTLTGAIVHTLQGNMGAFLGDYIVKGVNGEFYPCKLDIFEKTYEVEE